MKLYRGLLHVITMPILSRRRLEREERRIVVCTIDTRQLEGEIYTNRNTDPGLGNSVPTPPLSMALLRNNVTEN